MSKFKIAPRHAVEAPSPSIEAFGNAAPLVRAQSDGRPPKPVRLNLDLDPATHKRLKLAAIESGETVAAIVRRWIDHGLQQVQ